MVHEATFEDAYYEDAVAKRHSTISEAVGIGRDAGAARTVLTHFSQRYPALPADVGTDLADVVWASDLLHLTLPQLAWAPALLPGLKILYGDGADDGAGAPAPGGPV